MSAVLSGLLVGPLQSPHFERLFPLVAAIFPASLLPLALIRIERSRLARAKRAELAAAAGWGVAG